MVSIHAITTSDTHYNHDAGTNYNSTIDTDIGTNHASGNNNNISSSSSSISSNRNIIIDSNQNLPEQAGLFTNVSATTDAGPTSLAPLSVGIQVEEVIIVFLIVVVWIMAVAAFRRKWDSIRIMQPMEPRYKHIPKNLDSVKVVKRAQDSVIYKSYTRKMSTTMVARENRHLQLQRTLTMPCMNTLPSFHQALGTGMVCPTGGAIGASGVATGAISKKPTLPTIQMEEVTTEM